MTAQTYSILNKSTFLDLGFKNQLKYTLCAYKILGFVLNLC